jgi:hypothetical protein
VVCAMPSHLVGWQDKEMSQFLRGRLGKTKTAATDRGISHGVMEHAYEIASHSTGTMCCICDFLFYSIAEVVLLYNHCISHRFFRF